MFFRGDAVWRFLSPCLNKMNANVLIYESSLSCMPTVACAVTASDQSSGVVFRESITLCGVYFGQPSQCNVRKKRLGDVSS